MELRVKDDKVVGGLYLLLQLTLLFPKVLLLGEHSASTAASGTIHLRIAVTGISTSKPVSALLFGALKLRVKIIGPPTIIRPYTTLP